MTDVFSQSGLESIGYETNPEVARWMEKADTYEVDHYNDLVEVDSPLVRITNRTEEYWQHSAFSFVRDVFILPLTSHVWRKAAQRLTLSPHLETCVQDMLPDVLTDAIGLHIRVWPSDLSFGLSHACHRNEIPVLKYVWGKCDWTGSYLYDNVRRVEKRPDQPVIIATDNRNSTIVLDLIQLLGSRAHFLYVTEKCKNVLRDAHPKEEEEWRLSAYWPIIEAGAMTHTESFIGSFWSTFSQIVATRRTTQRTFFFQTRLQALIWDSRVIMGCLILTVGAYGGWLSLRRRLARRRKSSRSKEFNILA